MSENILRQIAWEKWVDPYGENMEADEWPGAFGNFETDKEIERIQRIERGEEDEDEWNEDYFEPKYSGGLPVHKKPAPMKILTTPMGIIPITEWSAPSRVFNFWIGHSNFRMTEEIQDIIDNTDGVESLDIFTPYRFRIAVGKAFNSILVKKDVMKRLNASPLQEHKDESINPQ
jgi:hypothetical protein